MATNEQVTKTIEQTLKELEGIAMEMIKMRTELEFRIDQMARIQANLKHLLSTDKRIEKLFE